MHSRCFSLALVCLAILAAASQATLGPDVLLRFTPEPGVLPELGQVYRFDLEITSSFDGQASNPQLISGRTTSGSDDWEVLSFPLPPEFQLDAGVPLIVSVDLLCNDPSEPFSVQMSIDGQSLMQSFFPLPQSTDLTYGGPDSGPEPNKTSDASSVLPGALPLADGTPLPEREPSGVAKSGETVTVSGTFAYVRNAHDNDNNAAGDGSVIGADGVSAYVYLKSGVGDVAVASQTLGPSGGFNMSFYNPFPGKPSFYIRFVAGNSKAVVTIPGAFVPYLWNTPVTWNYSGSSKNYGTIWPLSAGHHPALAMLSTLTKAWRRLDDVGYGGIPSVRVSWPDSDWPHYKSSQQAIFVPALWEWEEDMIAHEYGHHWTTIYNSFAVSGGYCNGGGRCDPANEDCRHCLWCQENEFVAWKEGFADWFSWVVTDYIGNNYESPLFSYDFEALVECDDISPTDFDDPELTEGFTAAFLQDAVDADQDQGTAYMTNIVEWLDLNVGQILAVVQSYNPLTFAQFLAGLRIQHSSQDAAIWSAAAINGFDYDTTPPGHITGFTSTSHATTGDSPDGTVDLVWNPGTDGESGVEKYRVRVNLLPLGSPAIATYETTTPHFTTPDLDPDVYNFYVQGIDWAGNSGTSALFGEVEIRAWEPADLAAYAGPWPYPIVPRTTTDTSYNVAPVPATLPGNSAGTYYNLRIANLGELGSSGNPRLYFWVDGLLSWTTTFNDNGASVPGFTDIPLMNIGPDVVRGGRHTLTMFVDALEVMPEPDEANNRYARQFVWTPYVFARGTSLDRIAPPDAFGGIANPGIFTSPNCDGFRFNLSGDPIVGVVMRSLFDDDDYDLRLHTASTGSQNGFEILSLQASSSRPGTAVDAVFVKNDVVTPDSWDVGVYNFDGGNGSFNIRRVESSSMATSTDVAVTLSAGELVALRHFNIPGGWSPTYGTVRLWADPADGPVKIQLIEAQEAFSNLGISTRTSVTNAAGYAFYNFTYTASSHGLVIFREPTDFSPGKVEPAITVTVRVEPTPADLVATTGTGWYAPLVPSYNAAGSPGLVPPPTTLAGNSNTTYINAHFSNQGPNPAVNFDNMSYLDGTALTGEQLAGIGGFANHPKNFPVPVTVRGGRHTLSMLVDPAGVVNEDNESNNGYGRQWVWSPFFLDPGPALLRSAPSNPVGGWGAAIASGQPVFYNCDGLRTPQPAPSGNDGYWHGVALMPGAASDVDLQLHEVVTGVYNGFAIPIEASTWGEGESDYLLVNFRNTSQRRFDVGALSVAGNESYAVQFVSSNFLGSDPSGSFGPFALGNDQLLNLHELHLNAGALVVDLKEISGDVDWGFTLHRAQLPFHSKSISAENTLVWSQPAGADEHAVIEIPQAGNYCLAVWKAQSDDRPKLGSYMLVFGQITATPELPTPLVSGLRSVRPNPFNPRTVISYDLEAPARAQLSVYNLRGELVRTLVDRSLPAGRHEAVWDGVDDGGRSVASGVYLLQLRAGKAQFQRKIALSK